MLMRVRGARQEPCDTLQHFIVYRSTDDGHSWERWIDKPGIRAASPVTLSQTLGSQPLIAANPDFGKEHDSQGRYIQVYSRRDKMRFWPLSKDRHEVGEPY